MIKGVTFEEAAMALQVVSEAFRLMSIGLNYDLGIKGNKQYKRRRNHRCRSPKKSSKRYRTMK